jgi:DNA-binding CsgD family transcriptional regulator/PAS domain-containing protein
MLTERSIDLPAIARSGFKKKRFSYVASMPEAEQLSALIADIYDTAFNADSWPRVLEKICAFIPGCASNVFSQDTMCNIAQIHYSWGDNADYVQLYFEKYIKMNPFFPAIAFGEVGHIGLQSDIVPFEEFHETRFYREWAQPQGYVDCVFCLLDKSESGGAMITVRRDAQNGLVDDEACRRMSLIMPHVRRAVLISRALEHAQAASAELTNLLDRMSAGILLIGAGGRIAYTNQAGDFLLAQNDVLSRKGDMLIVPDPSASLALSGAFAAAQSGDASTDMDGVALPLQGKAGEQYLAHVLPLTSGLRRRVGDTYAAVAAVFVRKASIGWASPAESVAKLYKLTPSELRVLLAVVEDGGIPQVAESLGISEETAKTHLRHIFEKTGQRRQADLVKLLAEHAHSML